jgi:hypothetical protein
MVHLEVDERVLQYVRVTYVRGISYYDLGPDKRNKLGGWVDSDFTSDIDSRKSMTGCDVAQSMSHFLEVFDKEE